VSRVGLANAATRPVHPAARWRTEGWRRGRTAGIARRANRSVGASGAYDSDGVSDPWRALTLLTIRLGPFDDHDIVDEGTTGRAALEAVRATPMDVCVIDWLSRLAA